MEEKKIEKIMLDAYKMGNFILFLSIPFLVLLGSLVNKEMNFNEFMLSGGIWILAFFWFCSFIFGNPFYNWFAEVQMYETHYPPGWQVKVKMLARSLTGYPQDLPKEVIEQDKQKRIQVYFEKKIWKKTAVWTTILTLLLLLVCYAIFLLKPLL